MHLICLFQIQMKLPPPPPTTKEVSSTESYKPISKSTYKYDHSSGMNLYPVAQSDTWRRRVRAVGGVMLAPSGASKKIPSTYPPVPRITCGLCLYHVWPRAQDQGPKSAAPFRFLCHRPIAAQGDKCPRHSDSHIPSCPT